MARVRPKRFKRGKAKKLQARSIGPFRTLQRAGTNAYVLVLPPEMVITHSKAPKRDVVEDIVDEQVISTRQVGYQKYLIKWKDRPDSDNTWVTKEELQHINPDILERYYSFISPEASSSQPGRIDEDIIVKSFKVYERNIWKEKAPNHSR
ncbi:hypothetical protein ACLB2K_037975 [Fragaria x ananassa]